MAATQRNDSILVFCEPTSSGTLETLFLEVLGLGKKVSRSKGQKLAVVALEDISLEAAAHGADQVYIAQTTSKIGNESEWYVALLEQACRKCNPEAVD